MMRAVLILAGVGTLVAIELATPPRTAKAVDEPPAAQSTFGISDSRDTLTKADRLAISYGRSEAPAQPFSFVERISPVNSMPVIPQEAPKITNRHWHDHNAKNKVAVVLPKPRPRNIDFKRGTNPDRSQAAMEVKQCRPNAFDSFLKALNLSSGCET